MIDPTEIDAIALRVVEMIRAQLGTILGAGPGLLTKDEIGQVMRVTPQTIDRWSREGMPFEDRGSYRLYDRAACEAWTKGRRKPGRPRAAAPAGRAAIPSLAGVELRTRGGGRKAAT